MDVEIVTFEQTKIAVIEHCGPPESEHESVKKLIAWRIENKLPLSSKHKVYGLHFNDPHKVAASEYRVDHCISVDQAITENSYGVINKEIPTLRCAKTTHYGSRLNNKTARDLYEQWFLSSNEELAGFPMIFHYVNVGPDIKEHEMITDLYLPIL